MITASVLDDELSIDGKAVPWFKRVGERWEYVVEGPGPNFRAIFTIRENDPQIREQHQHREDGEWIDIENPWRSHEQRSE